MRRQITIVFFTSAVVYVAGFLKLLLVANLFGVGAELDGYNLALVLPAFVSGIVSALLQTGLFPIRARLASVSSQDMVERFERAVLLVSVLLGLLLALVLALAMYIMPVSMDTQSASWQAARYVLPYALALIPLEMLGSTLGYLLAFRGRYHWFAAAPIINALFSMGLLAVWPEGRLLNLALGTLLGLCLQVGLCAWFLVYGGFRLFAPFARLTETAQEWREMLRLGVWTLPGLLFSNLTASLPTVFAASYGEGAVSAFGYAWRLHSYSVQLLVMGISSVILARFSELVAQGEWTVLRELLRRTLYLSMSVGIAAVIGVYAFGEPALAFIFRGRFDAHAVSAVTGVWVWLAFALGPVLLSNVLAKFFQACGRSVLLSVLAAIGLFIFLVGKWLAEDLGIHAIPISLSVSALVVAIAGWRKMREIVNQGVA